MLGGGVFTLAAWFVFKHVSLPAFNTSMVTRGLSTVGIVLTFVTVGWLLYGIKGASASAKRWRTATATVMAYLSPAMLVSASLALPLSASRLWLSGIQVDQVFRTQFLTRMTEQAGWADMNYLDMPTFYPMGWFWLGGRLANLLGIPGWEVFQPWSLISIAMAGCILVPVWQRLTNSLALGTTIALATTAITLSLAAEEPYSAVIAMGVPAAAILCSRAFHGSWGATIGLLIFLGVSASFYTLYTGAIALTVVTFTAIVTAIAERHIAPLIRLTVIAAGSLAIAAITWAPYLIAVARADYPLESTAQHFLPIEGTEIPVPFLAPSVVGVLSLIGIIYLIARTTNPHIRTLGWALIGVYLWILTSMALPLIGTTLLGFRLEILVVLIMSTAGILGLARLALLLEKSEKTTKASASKNGTTAARTTWLDRGRVPAIFTIIAVLTGIYYAQEIPSENHTAIEHAYRDTDGYGQRADQFPADSARYYAQINDFFTDHNVNVVMTDEKLFLAYYPYYGFNAFTSHYANPLGQFSKRNEQMAAWADASWDTAPEDFLPLLEKSPWETPDAMIFRGNLDSPDDAFKTHLAVDIFPSQPNVRYDAIMLNPAVFTNTTDWDVKQIGPYVAVARTR
ncbi:MAG: arabinofuranosyltransferase [Corynebacterium sp.]|nr:arabinofuranosyltransferase [Corynebacterium sp.]